MKFKYWLTNLIILISLLSAGSASPTLTGTTGLIMVPTAEALRYKEYNIGVDVILDGSGQPASYYYKANIGSFRGLELGIVGGTRPAEGVFINAKYYLLSDNSQYPLGIAFGGTSLTSASMSTAYLVVSKHFPEKFKLHGGFLAMFPNGTADSSVMGGIEFFPSSVLALSADIIGEQTAYIVNAAVNFDLTSKLQLRVMGINLTNQTVANIYGASSSATITCGLTWSDFLE